MTDLLARLAQRPPKPRMPQAATTNEWGRYQGRAAKRAEFDRDLALDTLERVQRLFAEALPKFNWGASALDANAIALLNTVPGEVATILRELRGAASGEGDGR